MRIIIIPARMDSKRFPGKPLCPIAGKPLLQWTYERAKQSSADGVIVAGDAEIYRWVQRHQPDWKFVPTPAILATGTHRCADAIRQLPYGLKNITRIVNLQVDEPMIDPIDLDFLLNSDSLGLCIDTLIVKNPTNESFTRAIYSEISGECHWFSRVHLSQWQHVGVYGYSPTVLNMLGGLQPTTHSRTVSLEQLAWIEHGFKIYGHKTSSPDGWNGFSINTPEDAQRMEQHWRNTHPSLK